jgi:hypothetical protein
VTSRGAWQLLSAGALLLVSSATSRVLGAGAGNGETAFALPSRLSATGL